MANNLESIIKSYNPKTIDETKAILRELLQEIVLVGLSRSKFFEHASFYGGTALRIFYGLNRYSEDLDFTLNYQDPTFSLEPFTNKIKEVASSYGLEIEIVNKTTIDSAFAKLNTYRTFINLKLNSDMTKVLHRDELLKVKFEIDCNPALGFTKVTRWLDTPEFSPIVVLDEKSLFAGKLHAILCRNYNNTVKGRDYYDFLFYIRRRIKPNMTYLKNKLIDSGKITANDEFNIEVLKGMLIERFNNLDFKQVTQDARRFVFKDEDLSYYSKELFIDMVNRL